MTRPLLVLIYILLIQLLNAQEKLPLIRATSKQIRILDGDDLLNGQLIPELKPDVYPYHRTTKPKLVTYYTDLDSISFKINFKETYDFIILLNEKDSCFQRITATKPNKVNYISQKRKGGSSDTIPFTLGPNSAIHVKGTINNSSILDLIFDTGASIGVLSDQGKEKNATLNSDNKNHFEFEGIRIENSPINYIDYRGGLKADGVIGFNAFEDKVVEIDYDKKILVIHDSAFTIDPSFSTVEMKWRGDAMFIEGFIHTDKTRHKGLYLFDTGSKWALSLTKTYCSEIKISQDLQEIGTRRARGANGKTIVSNTVLLPKLEIGGVQLFDVPTDLELPSKGEGLPFNILGNDALKRFNVIIDYQKSLIHLKKNSLVNLEYTKSIDIQNLVIRIAVFLVLLTAGVFIYKRTRKKKVISKT